MKVIINSDRSLSEAIDHLRGEFAEKKYLIVNIRAGRNRSLDQNALAFAWYGEISSQTFQTVEEVHAECKLNYAVPILKAELPEFAEFYETSLSHLAYEQQLEMMKYLQATSLMTTPQMQRFLDTVQREYAKQGIRLEVE